MPGESTTYNCGCQPAPGTVAPGIAPYVISLNSLYGIVGIAPDGGVSVRTEGNTIFIGANGSAGLGTVTSINATSSNTNLVVTGGPITTTGTFSFSLTGALNSISGLVTSADKMIYTTALDTYAVTSLTPFARNLLSDANSTLARITLGLVIGTDVQAHSTTLDAYNVNSNWTGSDVSFDGALSIGADLVVLGTSTLAGDIGVTGGGTFSGTVTAALFSGSGASLTALNGSNISSGTVGVVRGGTGLTNYTVGDLLYASSTNVLARLNSVAGSKYLRSTNPGFAPAWSTLNLSNSATTGDLFYGSSANTMGNLADVATGNVLLSGGVGAAPAYGKVTGSHTDGTTIATISGGANTNIASLDIVTITTQLTSSGPLIVSSDLQDGLASSGNNGDVLTSTGSGVLWSNQITIDTIVINTSIGIEGTITGAGTTGAQIINKPSGTVRFAGGASSLVVTNNLCTTSHRVLACVCTNDTTAYVKNVTTTTGSFTIVLGAAATAETEVYWQLNQIT